MTVLSVIGLGEAGRLYASGLGGRDATVFGYDPYQTQAIPGVTAASSLEAAVRDAEVVLSLVGGGASGEVGRRALRAMTRGQVFADLNSGSPDRKKTLSEEFRERGVLFADTAVLAPVPRAGVRTPVLISGDGAERVATLLGSYGAPAEVIGKVAGEAASRKLLRSVFMKGLATLVIETTRAGEAAGCGPWVHTQIAQELGDNGSAMVQRLIAGTNAHAARRLLEMDETAEYLDSLGSETWMTDGTRRWLEQLAQNSRERPTV